ncbi:MAG: adenosylcobinamide amidohydrolase, partial [Thermoproteota archaeon]
MNKWKLDIPISGVRGKIEGNTIVIQSEFPLTVLSSALLNGGLQKTRTIIHQQIPVDQEIPDPEDFLKSTITNLNLHPENVVGLMTVTDTLNLKAATTKNGRSTVHVLVTGGLSNPVATNGGPKDNLKEPDTLNIILIIDGNLTESCLVNA